MKFLFLALIFFLISSCNRVSVITTNNALDGGIKFAPTLTLSTTSLSVDQGMAITDVTSIALDFSGTVLFSISPTLPSGLNFDTSSGRVYGTPLVPISLTSFTITADDGITSKTASFDLLVRLVTPHLVLSATSLTLLEGASMTAIASTPSNFFHPISYSVSPALPAGVTLNTSTGTVSGTPTIPQALTNYVITADDGFASTTASFSIQIRTLPSMGLSASSLTVNVGEAITAITASSANFLSSVTYSISPSLPSGLVLNTSSGTISGTPTLAQGATSYTVTASDGYESATAAMSIVVNALPTLNLSASSVTIKQGSVMTPITSSVSNFLYTVNYSISPSAPWGLSFDTSTGAISGTPNASQAAQTYTITASDGVSTKTASLSLTIRPTPSMGLSASSLTVNVGEAITAITASSANFLSSVTYSISPSLPSGLILNTSSGTISGTPTVTQGATSYTVTASDGADSASASLSISIRAVPALALSSSSVSVNQGSAITPITSSASNFLYTINYSISPALPDGLSLDISTGVVSGTPTAAQPSTSYTMTADDGLATKTASFSLTVISLAPTLIAASQSSATFGTGVTIAPILFTFTGTVTTCSIQTIGGAELSTLAGLGYNNADCQIWGRPREAMEETTFYVVATNSYGQSNTLTVSLKIEPAPSISSITPAEVFTDATDTLEIGGTGFVVDPGLEVKVEGTECPIISASPTQIFCDLPSIALAAGHSYENKPVVVINSNGFSSGVQFIRYKNMTPVTSLASVSSEVLNLNEQYSLCLTAQDGSAGAEADIYLPSSAIMITKISGIESADYLSSIDNTHCFRLTPKLDFYGEALVEVSTDDGRGAGASVESYSLTYLPWGGGRGTRSDPYYISDAGHLYHFVRLTHGHVFPAPPTGYSEYLSAHFIQTSTINLNVSPGTGNVADDLTFDRGFAKNHLMQLYPYGTSIEPSPFTGHYDGNENSIEGTLDYIFSFIPLNSGYFGRLRLYLNISVETADLPNSFNFIYGIVSQKNYGAIQDIFLLSGGSGGLSIKACDGLVSEGALGGITGENFGAIHKIYSDLNISSDCHFEFMGGISGKFSNGYMIDNTVKSLMKCTSCRNTGGIVGEMSSNFLFYNNGAFVSFDVNFPYMWESMFNSLTLETAEFSGTIYGGTYVGGIVGRTTQNSKMIHGPSTDSEIYFPPSTILFAKVLGENSINGGMCTGTVVGESLGGKISNTYSNVQDSSTPFIGCATSGSSFMSRGPKFINYGDLVFNLNVAELFTVSTSDDTPFVSPLTQIQDSRFDTGSGPLIGQETGDRFFIFNNILLTSVVGWPSHARYVEDHNYSNMTNYGSNLGPIQALNPLQLLTAECYILIPTNGCYLNNYYPTLNMFEWELDGLSIPYPFEQAPKGIPDFYEQNPNYIPIL